MLSRHRRRVAARWIGAGLAAALATVSYAVPAQGAPADVADTPIPSLKETYADYFNVGNIYSGRQTYQEGTPNWAQVDRHYNVMTAENIMKPDQLLPDANINLDEGTWDFTFDEADYFVNESLARDIKVHGHVLVWHSQSPSKLFQGTRDQARANMERYIETVLTHFKGRVVSWDVVNEAFRDGLDTFDPKTQNWEDFLRGGPGDYASSGWYTAYTKDMDAAAGESPGDFIYDAFVFARKYGPETKLEYNDFNVFQSEGKGKAIIAMATELNQRYAAEYPDDPRQLIETIGLQSHNYISQTPAFACSDLTRLPELVDEAAEEWQPGACSNHASVERSLQMIIEAGFTANVSELDLQVWEAWNAEPEGSDPANYADLNDPSVADRFYKDGFTYWVGKIENRMELEAIQAQRYAEYFAVYKKYSQDMDRVTFWGLTDHLNWRATHNPQLFNRDWSEKLSADAVADPEGWLSVKKPIIDESRLTDAIVWADSLDLRGKNYKGATLGAVNSTRGKANAVLRSNRTQGEVNAATEALVAAITALQPK
ncbi:endo-1,4-beta-xylanase [Tessaracoccus sp. MC1865]|uniref:endo-1,4-beta-xylanase n=1 Tax=Tessaracoccus sp. MC1865 TaxID=2760310 RepID=UPI001603D7AF|nr:endo-1,4-beta-xylanase [Tessaracoccus sp. MC1865]MBB1483864.1 endo-1,4-beta-xylanase [Tessaracoccus sp. MC1865]QTO36919.1 endo-1,4-beta-xylanase [Tessaracoccus sp. MC1865]